MSRYELVCVKAVTVEAVGRRQQARAFKKGERFTSNRWYFNQLLERYPDHFKRPSAPSAPEPSAPEGKGG